MGRSVVDVTTNGTLVEQTEIRELSPGMLQAGVVMSLTAGLQCGELLARMFLQRGGIADAEAVACICDDYVYTGHAAAWDGAIRVLRGDQLRLVLMSSQVARIRGAVCVDQKGDC
jgi:hypothetical protein